jgi:hypothetical protein
VFTFSFFFFACVCVLSVHARAAWEAADKSGRTRGEEEEGSRPFPSSGMNHSTVPK